MVQDTAGLSSPFARDAHEADGGYAEEGYADARYADDERSADEVDFEAEAQDAQRCRARWLAELATYPAEVRHAVANAPSHGALDVYLWAVRQGVRSQAKLHRLVYFTLYGEQHGWCAPATAAARGAWAEVPALLRAYKRWPQPPRAQTGAAPCAKGSARPVPRDQPALDITGRYYTLNPPATFVINQAGLHIEGVASSVLDASSAQRGDHRPVIEFQGDLHGTRYQWFNRSRPSNFGQIAANQGRFFVSQGVDAQDKTVWELLRPIEKARATLLRPGDMDRSFDLVDRHELTPLTPRQMAFIREVLDKTRLEQIFDLYFNRQKRDEAMGFLIRRLVDTPDHASYVRRLETFHDVDLPLVRRYAQHVLAQQKWKSPRNVIRSHGDWIQMMMDRSLRPGALSGRDFERYLGLRFDPRRARDDGEHSYEFSITLTGASLLLAGYVGTAHIKKTSGRTWEHAFDIELWGANAALSIFDAKIGSSFKGAARSYLEWTENDVPGAVRMARASASIAMDTASSQVGFMHVLGDESLPLLEVFFQDAGLGVPNINKILEEAAKGKFEKAVLKDPAGGLSPKGVLGPDLGFSALFGSISPKGSWFERLRDRNKPPNVIDLSRDVKTDVSVARSLSAQTHFCLGSHVLSEAAVQALRIVCARELPLLMSPQSFLTVIGHADTLGRGRYDNEALSQRRADSVVRAMRDILGARLRIPDDGKHIRKIAAGDKYAAQESGPKTTAAPKHRRVQVFLNGVLVLTLYGSGTAPRGTT
jgi:outer membrane protein OmpA-like peptidoglycan-associated protein